MHDRITVPVKIVNNERWAQLNHFGTTHQICGDDFRQKRDISFANGHRVRVFTVKSNVHWKIPDNVLLDIAEVAPANAPRRMVEKGK